MIMKTPREITQWLPIKDMPFLKAEADRLTRKEWVVEIQSKPKANAGIVYALVVLKDKDNENEYEYS